jgi:hypothetical protein
MLPQNYYRLGIQRPTDILIFDLFETCLGNDYCYTLKDIVVFLANADLSEVEYRKKVVQEGGATFIVAADRRDLKNYVTGGTDSCPQIDLQLMASYQLPPEAVQSAGSADLHTMSVEKMQEQRERYAANMEKAMQKTKSGGYAQHPLLTVVMVLDARVPYSELSSRRV